eukprot:scaffold1188_cov286-Prasinococcus_capsulatus_cf.AAC.2
MRRRRRTNGDDDEDEAATTDLRASPLVHHNPHHRRARVRRAIEAPPRTEKRRSGRHLGPKRGREAGPGPVSGTPRGGRPPPRGMTGLGARTRGPDKQRLSHGISRHDWRPRAPGHDTLTRRYTQNPIRPSTLKGVNG